MYTEWRDVYFNPEIALSPERFAMMEKLGFNHHNIHATPADGVKDVYEIDLESINRTGLSIARACSTTPTSSTPPYRSLERRAPR
jgi:arylsulfatase